MFLLPSRVTDNQPTSAGGSHRKPAGRALCRAIEQAALLVLLAAAAWAGVVAADLGCFAHIGLVNYQTIHVVDVLLIPVLAAFPICLSLGNRFGGIEVQWVVEPRPIGFVVQVFIGVADLLHVECSALVLLLCCKLLEQRAVLRTGEIEQHVCG